MGANRERAQRNLYVLNLPLDATTEQFQELFAQLGSVEHAVILATLDHAARRRGFILMSDPSQARAAIEHLNGLQWHNYRIEVSFAIVQRSGTPFSYETSDTNIEERPLQPDTISAGHQMNLQPLEHRQLTQRGHNVSEIHQAYQGRDDSILLLDGLDTDVVASPSMVRALTEPFGDVVDLRHTETGDNTTRRLSVLVQYCCSSSAALARLSLHGLIVGANRILATDAPPWSSVACAPYDRASRGAAGTGSGPIEPGYGYGVVSNIRDQWTSVSQPQLSLRMTPSPDEVTTSTRNLVHVDQQSDAHGWGPYFESWQSSYSLDTPSSNDCKDPVFVEKVGQEMMIRAKRANLLELGAFCSFVIRD
ncbi:uncharacterized protein UMAG_00254 [Mycosarcoma maydis]|uniref:RRM domain-containing protein n=1 Tax=Mycosarcoma maydis TaxID=5270 RepID=A0A0D1E7F4_MYCMD|nr:uncharacterized protein UMAG_00254 [Ustilago maydis 521]KIS71824.1 hypothetical protein UMAG_00254 [Ustilago maydis 521]|eukprot:XP_011386177.1 hypothetical protein UMAG_00254 [Ustilago maydis 521]